MASLLRKIVAGPRSRHPDGDLDLCYVTDNIIATSGPSSTYPQRAYRNPLDTLTKFLNKKHGANWAIWEFRAEGTGYPDEAVGGRIWHFPWPDHHPPPFKLIPNIMASMRDWLMGVDLQHGEGKEGKEKGRGERVVVVHCKAGKGRSGTASCSYLISEEGWTKEDAVQRFTERRMRPGWGSGVSIPSQLRWLGYVERWKNGGKIYVERKVEVTEVHIWGLKDGVKISVRGFVDEGKVIKVWHTFTEDEREIVRGEIGNFGFANAVWDVMGSTRSESGSKTSLPRNQSLDSITKAAQSSSKLRKQTQTDGACDLKVETDSTTETSKVADATNTVSTKITEEPTTTSPTTATSTPIPYADAVFRPKNPITLTSNDINIDTERRTKGAYTWAVTTSIAHVWFNTFFEGDGPENKGQAADSGVFEIEWDRMDGIKGSSKRGARAFDKIAVVWKVAPGEEGRGEIVREPGVGENVTQPRPADWKGSLEAAGPDAGAVKGEGSGKEESDEEDQGTKVHM